MKVKIRIVCCLLIASLILPMFAFAEDGKSKPVDPNVHLLLGIGMTAFGFYEMGEASKMEKQYADTPVESDAKSSADSTRSMGVLFIGIGIVNFAIYSIKKEAQKVSVIPYNNNTILMAYNISF